jgi:hypothetical protein
MSDRSTEGHPLVVMIIGAFLGGVCAGGMMATPWEMVVLVLGGAFFTLWVCGHTSKKNWDTSLGVLIGLSTTVPLPCGFVGYLLGRTLWGTP